MRIAIAGSGQLAASMLFPLLDSDHEVAAVLLDGRSITGIKRSLSPLSDVILGNTGGLAFHALRHGLPIVWLDRMDEEELAPLRALHVDIVLVGGFGIIFKRPILDLPKIGCVNMHSSLLPKHRGPNPFCAVILAGEQESGVTFHIMEEKIDSGDILEQASFPLTPDDTPYSIHAKSCSLAAEWVVPVMDRIQAKGLHGVPQDVSQATYDKRPTRADAFIHWAAPAEQIERQVRALRSIHTPWFSHRGKTVHVTQVRVDYDDSRTSPGTILSNKPYVRIAAGNGSVDLVSAYTAGPVPLPWPVPWHRPKIGESMAAFE